MKKIILIVLTVLAGAAYAGEPGVKGKKEVTDPPKMRRIPGRLVVLGGGAGQGMVINCERVEKLTCCYVVKSAMSAAPDLEPGMYAPCVPPVPVVNPEMFRDGVDYVGFPNENGGVTYTEVTKVDIDCAPSGTLVTIEPAITIPAPSPTPDE